MPPETHFERQPSNPKFSQGDCFVFRNTQGEDKTAIIVFPYLVKNRDGWNYLTIEGEKEFMEIVKHFSPDNTQNEALRRGQNFMFEDDIEASVFFEFKFSQPEREAYKIFSEEDLSQLPKECFSHLPHKFFTPAFKNKIPLN